MIAKDCFADARENIDAQILRLTNCTGAGTSLSQIKYDTTQNPILYELPGSGKPVVAPLDSTITEPGVKTTVDPAPAAGGTVSQGSNKIGDWVKENPYVAGGVAVLAIYLLTRKRKR